ncbi:MAG: Tetratricopeptide repeat [Phormidesmis priestleyi Ana]|uniref:Tetratricopeptide repeat n=1 Tax=Phormidesmis priestleyi Ana TaxID=1666911 RepID=A0A0N8KNL2_9CYAN|nr:MAG: Tetratricopeptide repeat [Phormidesmis priestleyi Ana]
MAFKRDSWLVKGVLIIAVAAFVAVPILFAFNSRTSSRGANTPPAAQTATDANSQIQGRIDGYKAVLEREPDNQTALAGIIEAQIELGDLEGAVKPLERLAELNPNTPEYSILLAQTKQQLNDLEGAAQIYRRVLTQSPGSVPALEGLVALLVSQERTEAAIGLLRDTLSTADQTNELTPGSVDKLSVKLLLGQVFVEQKNYDEAVKMYDEAIADAKTASPTQPDFRPTLAKGLVLQEKGDTTAAKALFDEALALAPTQYKDGVQQLITEKTGPAANSTTTPEAGAPEASAPEAEETEVDGSSEQPSTAE